MNRIRGITANSMTRTDSFRTPTVFQTAKTLSCQSHELLLPIPVPNSVARNAVFQNCLDVGYTDNT